VDAGAHDGRRRSDRPRRRGLVLGDHDGPASPRAGLRTCLGILALEKTYGQDHIEAACQRAGVIRARSVSSVRSILKTGLDRAFLDPEPDPEPLRHGNIRGRTYFH
jgi:transposase